MVEWFSAFGPIQQALMAGLFTWSVTALGAALVVFAKVINQKLLDAMLGFAAGVMLAASYWSLLAPSIELAESLDMIAWLPAGVGLVTGGAFLWLADQLIPHLHPIIPDIEPEGPPTSWHRTTLLVTAITLHNIPEGLAVGVAFGAVASGMEMGGIVSLSGAIALAIGIGIQNFPEGIAVAMPIRAQGSSRLKSFWYGQLSAVVEPIAAVLGAAAVVYFSPILPYALAFAAGAMIYVVIEELIPESHSHDNGDIATTSALFGFLVMMTLDVALG
ncbi:MAG: ZIP family metal transporter [Bacteroidetes Order II. Incertae sedis bacterium]|jgi:zinc transporter, ZIP family|nr:ZIP family metal transporter [Bacteroidetes Order II. bacterium]MBT4051796.1 ZIP family metal transporter [Bacteroidetes Order II. bacterium]MBT4602735.1 ZIP family metal transporter [Bacteroidetes Order II. bacterium]MBT5250566.1 ZIP family metal transporter [Bacteroidetes Order II. bacterium]MBT6201243.1 ZIP family metal transporter [Bacteroidetes Order II. bacterium]